MKTADNSEGKQTELRNAIALLFSSFRDQIILMFEFAE